VQGEFEHALEAFHRVAGQFRNQGSIQREVDALNWIAVLSIIRLQVAHESIERLTGLAIQLELPYQQGFISAIHLLHAWAELDLVSFQRILGTLDPDEVNNLIRRRNSALWILNQLPRVGPVIGIDLALGNHVDNLNPPRYRIRTEAAVGGTRAEKLNYAVISLIRRAIDKGVFPGSTIVLWHAGSTVIEIANGTLSQGGYETDGVAVQPGTVYDVASLTKIVACIPVMVGLHESGRVDLDRPLFEYLPEFGCEGERCKVTARHVLTHTAGLPVHVKLFRDYQTRDTLIRAALAQPLMFAPGKAQLYSDVGYIVLTALAEKVVGLSFDQQAYSDLIIPFGMGSTVFRPSPILRERIAPTEFDEGRGGLIRGTVHDENASVMNGISGHAGLFSTSSDLGRFCETILKFGKGLSDERRWAKSIATMIYDRAPSHVPPLVGLGWISNAPKFMGELARDDVFGHTGFTGTLIMLSHTLEFALVFLSNRVCPTRTGPDVNAFRRELCSLVKTYLFTDPNI
jgi:CubicO group peptidase (beta-lactamase class C family)